jgi:hypothetical protein
MIFCGLRWTADLVLLSMWKSTDLCSYVHFHLPTILRTQRVSRRYLSVF